MLQTIQYYGVPWKRYENIKEIKWISEMGNHI